jgi:hypothetical protein
VLATERCRQGGDTSAGRSSKSRSKSSLEQPVEYLDNNRDADGCTCRHAEDGMKFVFVYLTKAHFLAQSIDEEQDQDKA